MDSEGTSSDSFITNDGKREVISMLGEIRTFWDLAPQRRNSPDKRRCLEVSWMLNLGNYILLCRCWYALEDLRGTGRGEEDWGGSPQRVNRDQGRVLTILQCTDGETKN